MTALRDRILSLLAAGAGLSDEQKADAIVAALVPESGLLVSFETASGEESDWESGYQASWTTLANPVIVGHRLSEGVRAALVFELEAAGSFGERDAYSYLDEAVRTLGADAAEAVMERAARERFGS